MYVCQYSESSWGRAFTELTQAFFYRTNASIIRSNFEMIFFGRLIDLESQMNRQATIDALVVGRVGIASSRDVDSVFQG